MLGARHAAERLQNCWHGGARSTGQLRDSMADFLAECAFLPAHMLFCPCLLLYSYIATHTVTFMFLLQ